MLERSEFDTERLVGALLDLGVSSHQIETTARGFSFRPGTPLIMRMGGTTGGRRPAAAFLNEASEEELGRVFREYAEERRWRRLAREVVRQREARPLETSDDLVEALERALGRPPRPRDKARVFQAVRIAVNRELEALEEGLPRIRDRLAQEGRIVVISYHSLEDRIVKHAFREWSRSCVCPPGLPVCRCRGEPLGRRVVDGPVSPSPEEVRSNPRARSAKLRAWEAS
jgi:16S rRNA (cytosine1402-N4)-methyltransferase